MDFIWEFFTKKLNAYHFLTFVFFSWLWSIMNFGIKKVYVHFFITCSIPWLLSTHLLLLVWLFSSYFYNRLENTTHLSIQRPATTTKNKRLSTYIYSSFHLYTSPLGVIKTFNEWSFIGSCSSKFSVSQNWNGK